MHVVIVGTAYLINNMSCGKRPQSFSGGSDLQMTFWVGHMTRFMRDTSLFELQIFKREADTFVGYFEMFLTKLYHRDCHDHLDISGCQWLSIGMSSTFESWWDWSLGIGMPWCMLWRSAPRNSVMYSMVPLVAS
jgi:hypothetical protein